MITDFECVLVSYMASKLSSTEQAKIKKDADEKERFLTSKQQLKEKFGWRLLLTTEDVGLKQDGYFGVAFFRCRSDQTDLVIGHRGTDFNEKGNILADMEIAEQKHPAILKVADVFTERLFSLPTLGSALPETLHVVHTGFSLGGFIAAASVVRSSRMWRAVTFDAPGAAYLAESLGVELEKQAQVVNYVATVPNLVNTCNKHFGEVRQVQSSQFEPREDTVRFHVSNFFDLGMTAPLRTTSNPSLAASETRRRQKNETLKLMSELLYALDSHDLWKIIQSATKDELPYRRVMRWPVADNTLLYGEQRESELGAIKASSQLESFVFSMVASVAQFYKDKWIGDLWDLTKREVGGTQEGLIGISHSRENTIFYTAEDELGLEGDDGGESFDLLGRGITPSFGGRF